MLIRNGRKTRLKKYTKLPIAKLLSIQIRDINFMTENVKNKYLCLCDAIKIWLHSTYMWRSGCSVLREKKIMVDYDLRVSWVELKLGYEEHLTNMCVLRKNSQRVVSLNKRIIIKISFVWVSYLFNFNSTRWTMVKAVNNIMTVKYLFTARKFIYGNWFCRVMMEERFLSI